jgi:hypothetical protein
MPAESVIAAPKPSICWYCTELVTFHTFPADGATYWRKGNYLQNTSNVKKIREICSGLHAKRLKIWNLQMELIFI